MFALYGTHGEYLEDVLQNGIHRESAAYFVIPSNPEPGRFRITLCCAVYHAMGLKILNGAIRKQITLREAVEEVKGLYLVLFQLESQKELRQVRQDWYVKDGTETYPYRKIKNAGVVFSEHPGVLKLSEEAMEVFLYLEKDVQTPRFFQKKDGAAQYLNNCDGNALLRSCEQTAQGAERRLMLLLRGIEEEK